MINNIKIAGMKYEVKETENLTRDHGSLGNCCGNNLTINVDKDLKEDVKKKTLLHEIIEALNFEYDLEFQHNKICVLETALFAVIKDNTELIKYLSEV
jgi:regulator of RNase E activity RraB